MLSPRPLPMRFFHSARLLTMPVRTVWSSHSRRIAGDGGAHGPGLNNLGVFADQNGIDFVSFVAAQFGAGEVTDLGRVGNADDVAGVVQRQRHAEAVTTGRLHADVSLLAAHGSEPSQHQLPAIGAVLEGPALFSLTSCAVRVQASPWTRQFQLSSHSLLATISGVEHGKAPRRATLYTGSAASRVPGYRPA